MSGFIETAPEQEADPAFRRDILAGLTKSPKATPPVWFYDRHGSDLFERITRLPEYYPTRAESAILAQRGGEIAALIGPGRCVVEFGAGSLAKTPLLLRAIDPAAYVPVDISGDHLRESVAALAETFAWLPLTPVEADFTRGFELPPGLAGLPRLGFFPGSTIGNFEPAAAVDLLRGMGAALGEGAMLLIGMDRIKSPDVLIPAYDDALAVTAAFNLNLLHRINRQLDGTIPVDAFRHEARWNDDAARVEMHLRAAAPVRFRVAGQMFAMDQDETIHTESSHKYGRRSAALLLRAGGWEPLREWRDAGGLFSVWLAEVRRQRSQKG